MQAYSPAAFLLLFPPQHMAEGKERIRTALKSYPVGTRRGSRAGRAWRRAAGGLAVVLILAVLAVVGQHWYRSSIGSVAAGNLCPAAPAGGYAYLDGQDLYYRSAIGAPPRRLTSTGGRVDDFWWVPGGRQIAYKEAAAPPGIAGDVRLVDLASGKVAWDLGGSVEYFAVSPDGRSWAAGTVEHASGNVDGVRIYVGSFTGGIGSANSFNLSRSTQTPIAYDTTHFQDSGTPYAVRNQYEGVFWLTDGIYVNLQRLTILTPERGPVPGPINADDKIDARSQAFPLMGRSCPPTATRSTGSAAASATTCGRNFPRGRSMPGSAVRTAGRRWSPSPPAATRIRWTCGW